MSLNLNRKLVTKEALMNIVEDVDVYRFYTGKEIHMGGNISSPLRKDTKPSFGYFVGNSGELCFKDFVLGAGDCVKFVQIMFNLNFFEALSKIVVDFDLEDEFIHKDMDKTFIDYSVKDFKNREAILKDATELTLGKRERPFTAKDYAYWLSFGIDAETLKKYRVQAIDYVFVNKKPFYVNKYGYAYVENKDGKETYKIYQPFSEDFKWLNNHNDSVWQGWEQLPRYSDKLIITKSLKDVMAIDAVTGIATVSLQSESVRPKEHIIAELSNRFACLYILYDNDFDKEKNWGRILGESLADEFNFIQIEIPYKYQSKDFSDLVKNHGKDTASRILYDLTGVPF